MPPKKRGPGDLQLPSISSPSASTEDGALRRALVGMSLKTSDEASPSLVVVPAVTPSKSVDSLSLSPSAVAAAAAAGSQAATPVFDLSKYKQRQLLGAGAQASVYLLTSKTPGEFYALKKIDVVTSDTEVANQLSCLAGEAAMLQFWRHNKNKIGTQCILRVFGHYVDAKRGRLLIIMEYMNFGSLDRIVNRSTRWFSSPWSAFVPTIAKEVSNWDVLACIFAQVLVGLECLHQCGIVHRDLRPSNCLLNDKGAVKLGDFGLSKTWAADNTMSIRGHEKFLPPEALKEEWNTHMGPPYDIWSVGVSLAEVILRMIPTFTRVAGTLELETDDPDNELVFFQQVLVSQGQVSVKWIDKDRIEVFPPADLANFVSACLTYNPLQRPSATELMSYPFILNRAPQLNNKVDVDSCRSVVAEWLAGDHIFTVSKEFQAKQASSSSVGGP